MPVRKLTTQQITFLISILKKGPRYSGYGNRFWKLSQVQTLIKGLFSVQYSIQQINPLLNAYGYHVSTQRQRKNLLRLSRIAENRLPRDFGLKGERWNVDKLNVLSKRMFGHEYDREYLSRYMLQNGIDLFEQLPKVTVMEEVFQIIQHEAPNRHGFHSVKWTGPMCVALAKTKFKTKIGLSQFYGFLERKGWSLRKGEYFG